MAEEKGFEPLRRSRDLPVFKTGPFNQTWVFLQNWCLRSDLNRHELLSPQDFKSCASTYSATQAFTLSSDYLIIYYFYLFIKYFFQFDYFLLLAAINIISKSIHNIHQKLFYYHKYTLQSSYQHTYSAKAQMYIQFDFPSLRDISK